MIENDLQLAVIAIASVIATTITSNLASRFKEIRDKLRKIPILIIFIALRVKKTGEDVLNHSVRKRIADILEKRGEATFGDLMKELGIGRATLEWHLYKLITEDIVYETRIEKTRIYRPNKP